MLEGIFQLFPSFDRQNGIICIRVVLGTMQGRADILSVKVYLQKKTNIDFIISMKFHQNNLIDKTIYRRRRKATSKRAEWAIALLRYRHLPISHPKGDTFITN